MLIYEAARAIFQMIVGCWPVGHGQGGQVKELGTHWGLFHYGTLFLFGREMWFFVWLTR